MASSDNYPEQDLSHFEHFSWCKKLLSNPDFSLRPTNSRTPKPTTEDTFFGATLATSSTICACVTLIRRPSQAEIGLDNPYPAISEVRTLVSLGSGVNGYPHIAHGGFAATLLDEVMGILLGTNKDYEEQRARLRKTTADDKPWTRFSTMTASLNVNFIRPIPTPGILLLRAWFESVEGRKHFVCSSIENGAGVVLTSGKALFLRTREKL